jgi:hypothetical protein
VVGVVIAAWVLGSKSAANGAQVTPSSVDTSGASATLGLVTIRDPNTNTVTLVDPNTGATLVESSPATAVAGEPTIIGGG